MARPLALSGESPPAKWRAGSHASLDYPVKPGNDNKLNKLYKPNRPNEPNRPNNRGLTLVEILVVVSIFSILSTVLFTIFKGALDSWRRSEAILVMHQEGRAALDMMSREITSAFLYQGSSDVTQWTRFYGIDETAARIKKNSAKDELFFVAPVALDAAESVRMDLCEIGYWLDGKGTEDTSDDELMRHFKSFNSLPVVYNFAREDAGIDSVLATNVTDLQFTYYYRNAAGALPETTVINWDSSADKLTGAGGNYDANGNPKNPDGLPDAVGITITLRSRDGSQTKTFSALVPILGAR
ncbi:MAG: type II secretion system protein [Candidatus Omnitrophota bacterium]